MKQKSQIIFGLLIGLAIIGAAFWLVQTSPKTEIAKVVEVIDGDTIKTENQRVIRILGINTPERHETGFYEAKWRLESLILGEQVELLCWKKDKYNRDLCWVHLGFQDVAQILIKEGLGQKIE